MKEALKHKGPLITLLAGLAVAAVLLGVNMAAASRNNDAGGAAQPTGQPSPGAEVSPEPTEAPPPDDEVVQTGTYVGWVDTGDATIAIAITEDEVFGYLCDGQNVEAWLRGTAVDGELALTGSNGEELTGTYDDAKATGSATAAGRIFTFAVDVVEEPQGLYRFAETVQGAEVVGGWIVLPDGTQVGLLSVDNQITPAPALDLATGTTTINGVEVTVRPVASEAATGDGGY